MNDDLKPRTTSILGLTVQLSGTVRVSHPADWTRRQVERASDHWREVIAKNLDVTRRRILSFTVHQDDCAAENGQPFALDQDAFPPDDEPGSGALDAPDDDDFDDADLEDDLFEDWDDDGDES